MFSHCIEKINTYKHSADIKVNPILLPILDTVEQKLENFATDNALNFIPAVQWYIDHDMPSEAISMLKEGVVTYLIVGSGADYKNPHLRLVLGQRLSFVTKFNSFEYKGSQLKWEKTVEAIMKTELAVKLKPVIESFNSFRNDLDHGGFVEQARSPENLRNEIESAFNAVLEVFKGEGIIP